MISIERPRLTEDPQAVVGQFQKRLWMHPLVTPQALSFREKSMTTIENAFDAHQIDPEYCFTMPTGSFVFIPARRSDIDCFFLHAVPDDPFEKEKLERGIYEMELEVTGGISLLDVRPAETLLLPAKIAAMPVILLTPDPYITGNRELAQKTRFEVATMLADPKNLGRWKYVEEVYETFYRGWKNLPGDDGKRAKRFNEAVQAHTVGEKWRSQWESALLNRTEGLLLPQRETYLAAIIANNGKLSIANHSK